LPGGKNDLFGPVRLAVLGSDAIGVGEVGSRRIQAHRLRRERRTGDTEYVEHVAVHCRLPDAASNGKRRAAKRDASPLLADDGRLHRTQQAVDKSDTGFVMHRVFGKRGAFHIHVHGIAVHRRLPFRAITHERFR